jgi:hypothetical protein
VTGADLSLHCNRELSGPYIGMQTSTSSLCGLRTYVLVVFRDSWDKQSAALFGRPSVIHLRDCDVPEPLQIDDEYLTKEKILEQPAGHQTRLSAFVAVIRLHVVLEVRISAETDRYSFLTTFSS